MSELAQRYDWLQDLDSVKVVKKPWGAEYWLNYWPGEEVGDEEKRYVMKLLEIKQGTKTSFQYHDAKVETNFLVEGKVEAWFENNEGELEKRVLEANGVLKPAIWSIPAKRKHRIIALTDIVLLEASSPEVDDVIRLQDDSGRGCGRIYEEHK